MPEYDKETMNFLKEREDRLGSRIRWKTYSLYYGSSLSEEREYGVFMYTDGETFIFEDFDRVPTVMGIEIKRKNREEYVKLEHSFSAHDVVSVNQVTRSSALQAVKYGTPAKPVSGLSAKLRKTLTEVVLSDGTKYWFELMEPEKFLELIQKAENTEK